MTAIADKNRAGLMGPEQAKKVAAFGFVTGEGGSVTQLTSKSTGVTLDKRCGLITMHNASLAANTSVTFTLTNNTIATDDVLVVNISGGVTVGTYMVGVDAVANGSAIIHLRNVSGGAIGEAVIIGFAVIKVSIS